MAKSSPKQLVSSRLYKITHAEEIRAWKKAYDAEHREHISARGKAYHLAHAEKRRAYAREWAKKNKARRNATRRAAYQRKLAEDPAFGSKTYLKHAEKHRTRMKSYKLAHAEQYLSYESMRRAAKRAPGAEPVSLNVLYIRDKKTCTLCHKPVKRGEASIDHIVPLAHGGTHTYRNIALAHKLCNIRKRDKAMTQQLPLF